MSMTYGRGRGLAALPVLVVLLLLAGCGYAGAAMPSSSTPAGDTPTCTLTARGINNISSRGPGGSTVTRGDETWISCAHGPLIALTGVASPGVSFSEAGDSVTIAAGSAAAVGPYQVTVRSIDGDTAVFTMALPA
ncbi:MAG: hypothetical protein ACR2GE_09965 [Pseudonocardia sp.]